MKLFFLTILATILFSACSTSTENVAMNEYSPSVHSSTAATAVITPEMIKEVQERRAKYLREHGAL